MEYNTEALQQAVDKANADKANAAQTKLIEDAKAAGIDLKEFEIKPEGKPGASEEEKAKGAEAKKLADAEAAKAKEEAKKQTETPKGEGVTSDQMKGFADSIVEAVKNISSEKQEQKTEVKPRISL